MRLLPPLAGNSADGGDQTEDVNLSPRFAGYMVITQFHLDCLHVILDEKVDVAGSVLEAVLDGIGACSLAYATLRNGLGLKEQSQLTLTVETPWDDEDQVLLNESEYTRLPVR